MSDRPTSLVRIDATGAAHPVDREASKQMRGRQGSFRLLPSPPHALVLRQIEDGAADRPEEEAVRFWMSGEITKPGVLWDLIGMAGQGNWTGELVVIEGELQRGIFFERGAVVGASSSGERERLGEVLYHYGAITRDQLGIIMNRVTPEMRFGETAVALGFLAREKLFELLSKQAEEIVYATMLVPRGSFYFVEAVNESRLTYRLNLPVHSLLMEGVRRMDEIEHFRARIPSGLYVPDRVPGSSLPRDHEHARVFAAVDGHRSVDDIGRMIGLGAFDTTRAVFQLLQSAVVIMRPPRPTGPQAIVTLFNQAIALILSKVDEAGGGDDIREQLASFATASGVYDALFRDAGPAPDGTLDVEKIAESIQQLVGGENALGMLAQWLYEYASFAMFIAEPLLRSRVIDEASGPPTSQGAAVSRRVAELLAPLAPES
jgi:hypothetical protein